MPDFNQINSDSKAPYPLDKEKKFMGIKEAFQKKGKEMWIYIGIFIVVLGLLVAIIAGVSSSNKAKQQQAQDQALRSSAVQLSQADKVEQARKATRTEITKQSFNGAIQAAGLTLDSDSTAKTLKAQSKLLNDYSLAVGEKKGKAYSSAMEYREFKKPSDALAFTMNYCTTAISNVPGVKPNIYYFDNNGGEISATANGYYFRAYCYGTKVVTLGCSSDQTSTMIKIFNTIVQK